MDVANRLFRGHRDLVLLTIDADRVRSPIRYENLEGGTELFPHVYGSLNVDAVIDHVPLQAGQDGTFSWSNQDRVRDA